MAFLMENIGTIILCIGGLIVLASAGGGNSEQSDFAEEAWIHSKENPCGPNYEGI